jgi:hypothetical protein
MFKMVRLVVAAAVALSFAACSGVSSPSTDTTENFSGTLDPLGTSFSLFSVSKTGEMSITLLSLTPRPVVGFVALAIGVPSGSSCQPLTGYIVSQAAVGNAYSFSQITKGSYCVLVADPSAILTTSAAWTLRLTHP